MPANKKILLVEDDEFLHSLLVKKLTQVGYEVISAMDGEQALEMVEKSKPDLILLDIILPGIDGFEVAEKIKANNNRVIREVPIIVLSNLGQKEDIQRALSLGVTDYMIKANFTSEEILDKIQKVLSET